MNNFKFLVSLLPLFLLSSCDRDTTDDSATDDPTNTEARLIIKLAVDPDQARLGNLGEPASIPDGHAAQSPRFNTISAHYLELAPTATTPLGQGSILYNAPETNQGGSTAIDFEQALIVSPGEEFLNIPLSQLSAGSYQWVRLSLSYQNYDIDFQFNDIPLSGTVASFVGFDTYIDSYLIKDETVTVTDNKKQGYWGFESNGIVQTGQAPEGATTVPNPLFDSSPIPQGSCVVTAGFETPLQINGDETQDIVLTLSLSTNQSFEWIDTNGNGIWDVTSDATEPVVDMGLRGLKPSYEN